MLASLTAPLQHAGSASSLPRRPLPAPEVQRAGISNNEV